MTALELDDAAVWQWWCRQAAEQGRPAVITDSALIARLITLAFAGAADQHEGGGGRARSA
jgi:hypothetical protein